MKLRPLPPHGVTESDPMRPDRGPEPRGSDDDRMTSRPHSRRIHRPRLSYIRGLHSKASDGSRLPAKPAFFRRAHAKVRLRTAVLRCQRALGTWRYAVQPNSSWADQPDNDGMGSAVLTAFRLVQHAQMVHSGVFSVLWEW